MNEKQMVKVTQGMANANRGAARKCPNDKCGLGIPVYPGRYPLNCPDCGTPLDAPSVDEQVEMVKAGIPAADVVRMARGNALEACDRGIDAGHELIQQGFDMIREADPFSDIEGAVRKVVGKAKGAKAHVKQKAGEIKKHASDISTTRKKKKARGAKTKLQKAGKKRKKAEKKAKANPMSGKAQLAAEKAKKKHKKAAAKFRKTQDASKKKTKKESVEEATMRTSLTIQEDGIKSAIYRCIAESGSADLSKVARTFRANPIAVFNLVKENQAKWGLLVGGNGYIVHPRKSGDRLTG